MARAFIAFSANSDPFGLLALGAALNRSCVRLLPGRIEIRNPDYSDLRIVASSLTTISLTTAEHLEAEDALEPPLDVSSE